MKMLCAGATETVTGSCFWLEVADQQKKNHHFLVDCGMFQGEQVCGSRNLRPFPFAVEEIEAVFITHAHADHVGRLPKLVKEGFHGPIFLTGPTLPLMRLVLLDALHLMEEAAAQCGDPVLYGAEDVDRVLELCQPVAYHQAVTVAPQVVVMFHDAGHILGSAYISIEAEGKRLVCSGDLGNKEVPILPPTEPLSFADIVVCESTYGDRVHEPIEERETKLRAALETTVHQKGVLLIPAFSLERTQELLFAMNEIFASWQVRVPIFLDSPMAIRATQVYRENQAFLSFDRSVHSEPDRDFFSFPNLRECLSADDSKAIFHVPGPKVIIAGSGMMTGGRILHHLKAYLPLSTTTLLVIGYQADGTIGRQILEGASSVRIHGEEVPVKAQLKKIGAFSAHADQRTLLEWLKTEQTQRAPQQVILVHGDDPAKQALSSLIQTRFESRIDIPTDGETLEL